MKPVLFVVGMPPVVSGGAEAPAGIVQRASVCPAVQAGVEEAVSVSLAVLPVSVVSLIKR